MSAEKSEHPSPGFIEYFGFQGLFLLELMSEALFTLTLGKLLGRRHLLAASISVPAVKVEVNYGGDLSQHFPK